MAHLIVKIRDRYFEWSEVCDRPLTPGMPLAAFARYYRDKYGSAATKGFDERLDRADNTGTSAFNATLDELIGGNRAGADEECLTADEIYDVYSQPKPPPSPLAAYALATGLIVWWVDDRPYPTETQARAIANRFYDIHGDDPKIRQSIETAEALQRAIDRRVADRATRRGTNA
jgi:hypothetical protein